MTRVWSQEAALPGIPTQWTTKQGEVKDGNAFKPEDSVSGNGAVAGNNVKARRFKNPPGLGDFTVSDKAVVENIAALDAIDPGRLKIERVRSAERGRVGHHLGRGRASDSKELAFVGLKVELGPLSIDDVPGPIVFKPNVSARVGPMGIGVVIDLVGRDGHFGGLNLRRPFQVTPLVVRVLAYGTEPDFIGRWKIGLSRTIQTLRRHVRSEQHERKYKGKKDIN